MARKIIIGIIIFLVLIQFIRPARNNGSAQTANDITHVTQVPDSILQLLQTACYDCHSNHTKYPWYAEVNPIGLWLTNHVNEGKRELNFSEFATYTVKRKSKKFEEIAKTVKEMEMPLKSYLWVHDEARLSPLQQQAISNWAKAAKAQISAAQP